MKAVILAAGLGSRLRPLTDSNPKPLTRVGNVTILDSQLEALASRGASEVAIVTGYLGEKIARWIASSPARKTLKIHLINNEQFEITNNMFSLSLAERFIDGNPFFLLNGDVFHSNANTLSEFDITDPWIQIAGEAGADSVDAMKLRLDESGLAIEMSKLLAPPTWGISLDTYFFGSVGSQALFAMVRRHLEEVGLQDWTEVAIQAIVSEQNAGMKVVTPPSGLVEIDTLEDLARCSSDVASGFLLGRLRNLDPNDLCLVIDNDGTLTVGGEINFEVKEALRGLSQQGCEIFIASNNTSKTGPEFREALEAKGLEANIFEIITPISSITNHLRARGLTRLNLLATSSVKNYFVESGFEICEKNVDVHLLTYNPELTYADLAKFSALLVAESAPYFASHKDLTFPSPTGPWPDAGAFIQLFQACSGRLPDLTFGKPNVSFFGDNKPLKKVNIVVGDRRDTDVPLAKNLGFISVLVLSGVEKEETAFNLRIPREEPDAILPDLKSLLALIGYGLG